MSNTCGYCSKTIVGRRADALFCSRRCVNASRMDKCIADGVCVAARSHGRSVNGKYCAKCVEGLRLYNRRYEQKRRRSPQAAICEEHARQQRDAGYGKMHPIKSCLACQAKRAESTHVYTPLENVLESPAVRILRRLSRDGWVSVVDLMDSLGICEPVIGNHHKGEKTTYVDRNRYAAALARLFKQGSVERRAPVRIPGLLIDNWNEYRITTIGRQRLMAMLHYDTSAASDEEADLDAVVRVFGSLDVAPLEAA